ILVLAVSATDISVTVKTMLDLGRLNTPLGRTMLGVTILDGIVGLVVFTIAIAYIVAGNIGIFEFVKVIGSILFFFLLFFIIRRAVPKIVKKVGFFSIEESEFAFAFVFMLGLAITAELFGLHGIIGAFLAGMLLSRSALADTDFIGKLSTMSHAIFIPLFFVWTGLLVHIKEFTVFPFIIITGVLAANFVGAYIGGFIGGMKTCDRFSMAFGMFPRGGINIAIASIGITLVDSSGNLLVNGEMGSTLFSTVMLLIVISVIVGPLLLKSNIKGSL
ncbi:MAG: cation:proton antiporter, partial [Candidatus Diapherotrites archaeon]|nr:cation:proton antiporter [Candidatus Diapherotrites archaeon]